VAQTQAPPSPASEFYAEQQQRKLATLIILDRLWSRMKPEGNWSEQFGPLSVLMGAVVGQAQEQVARRAARYAADLAQLRNIDPPDETINPAGFAGWNGDGRTIEDMLGSAVAHSGQAFSEAKALVAPEDFNASEAAKAALEEGRRFIATSVATAMADTARAAASASLTATPQVIGYIRMLNPPSCSRCVVLAGRFYKWNAGFARHPGCDCVHIPETVANASGGLANPDAYFHSLGETQQNRIFTNAGAQAIRDGADISAVVNARSGMSVAQDLNGRKVFATSTGTTKRGWFGGGYAARKYGDTDWFNQFAVAKSGQKHVPPVRLMPESIYQLASDRTEAIALLKRYGFFL